MLDFVLWTAVIGMTPLALSIVREVVTSVGGRGRSRSFSKAEQSYLWHHFDGW